MSKLENVRGYFAKKGSLYLSHKNTWTKNVNKAVLFETKEQAGDSIARRPSGRVVASLDVLTIVSDDLSRTFTNYENIEKDI